MNSYDFFIHEFRCFMNSYMNLGVPRFQMRLRLVARGRCYGQHAWAGMGPVKDHDCSFSGEGAGASWWRPVVVRGWELGCHGWCRWGLSSFVFYLRWLFLSILAGRF